MVKHHSDNGISIKLYHFERWHLKQRYRKTHKNKLRDVGLQRNSSARQNHVIIHKLGRVDKKLLVLEINISFHLFNSLMISGLISF